MSKVKFTYKIPNTFPEIMHDHEFCEVCHKYPEDCKCPDLEFVTNNIRKTDGKVNAVGFFNNHGDQFFNLREIEGKIKELKEAILYTSNLYHKKDWTLLLWAAFSIKEKIETDEHINKG